MKFKTHLTVFFAFSFIHISAMQTNEQLDSLTNKKITVYDTDSLLESLTHDSKIPSKPNKILPNEAKSTPRNNVIIKNETKDTELQAFDSLLIERYNELKREESVFSLPTIITPIQIDSFVLKANPFFIDLVYESLPLNFDWKIEKNLQTIYYGEKSKNLDINLFETIINQTPEQFIYDLRSEARKEITRKCAHLYAFTFDKLPDPNGNKSQLIEGKPLEKIQFVDNDDTNPTEKRKIFVRKSVLSPWFHKASGLAQFSENTVSSNWYQGGNSNIAILGILMGQLNYDDKESIQWDNNAEWRMGFNSVDGDTLRILNANDDVLKINSKLGFKAGGNWFYSSSVDFSTQFFNSYKGANSKILKASFMTPVRLNIGIGLDYKYKKLFSLMISPVSFKYIYAKNRYVDPKLFGIKTGENVLSEFGSSLKAIFSYVPSREIQIDSKLSFYTNYQKVEIDWEMVCNMTINRFLSTRISINPRYDNTVILPIDEKAKIQFKQLVSVGFSHKFR
jgi:hypothetical protein